MAYLNLMEIDQAVQGNRAREMENQVRLRDLLRGQKQDAETDAYNNAFKGAVDETGNLNGDSLVKQLIQSGNGAKAWEIKTALDKQKQDATKAARESEGSQLELMAKKAKYGRDAMAGATPETWAQTRQSLISQGFEAAKSLPEQYDANAHRGFVMDADNFIKQYSPKFEKIDLGGNVVVKDINPLSNPNIAQEPLNKTLTPDQIENNRIQLRGQDMTNYRASEANALKAEENAIKRGEKVPEISTNLRKEFDDLPEVKSYKLAKTAYKSIEDATKRNTTASDINIVYGIAKLYDPTSVVREGEYATVANSPNIPEKIKGLAQYLSNGGRLTPQVKADILAEAQGRMAAYEGEYLPQRQNYEKIAKDSNADPKLVFPSEFQPAIKPKAAPAPKIGTIEGGHKYIGGDPSKPSSWKKL